MYKLNRPKMNGHIGEPGILSKTHSKSLGKDYTISIKVFKLPEVSCPSKAYDSPNRMGEMLPPIIEGCLINGAKTPVYCVPTKPSSAVQGDFGASKLVFPAPRYSVLSPLDIPMDDDEKVLSTPIPPISESATAQECLAYIKKRLNQLKATYPLGLLAKEDEQNTKHETSKVKVMTLSSAHVKKIAAPTRKNKKRAIQMWLEQIAASAPTKPAPIEIAAADVGHKNKPSKNPVTVMVANKKASVAIQPQVRRSKLPVAAVGMARMMKDAGLSAKDKHLPKDKGQPSKIPVAQVKIVPKKQEFRSKIPLPLPGMAKKAAVLKEAGVRCEAATTMAKTASNKPSRIPVPVKQAKQTVSAQVPVPPKEPKSTQSSSPRLRRVRSKTPKAKATCKANSYDDKVPAAILRRIQNGTKTPLPVEDSDL